MNVRIRRRPRIKHVHSRMRKRRRYQTCRRGWWRRLPDPSIIELAAQNNELVLIEALPSGHTVQLDVQTGKAVPHVRRWRDFLEPLLDWLDERAERRKAARYHRHKMKKWAEHHRRMKLIQDRLHGRNLPAFVCNLPARLLK